MGDLFFDLTCATCSVEGSESCTRQNLSWLVLLNNPLTELLFLIRNKMSGMKGVKDEWREKG